MASSQEAGRSEVMTTLKEVIRQKYSLNHLDKVSIKAPASIYDEAIVKVTLTYYSEGMSNGKFTICLPIVLPPSRKE